MLSATRRKSELKIESLEKTQISFCIPVLVGKCMFATKVQFSGVDVSDCILHRSYQENALYRPRNHVCVLTGTVTAGQRIVRSGACPLKTSSVSSHTKWENGRLQISPSTLAKNDRFPRPGCPGLPCQIRTRGQ